MVKGTKLGNYAKIDREEGYLYFVQTLSGKLVVMRVVAGRGGPKKKELVLKTSETPVKGQLYFIGKDGNIRHSTMMNS